ncbi:hypothetical protein [uncultured Agrococcus sp.]|uniref:hypothetical protein n=1 Tax=uncultured Agrococcus sp. TaxID=382258 RepID=UPI0025EA8A5D|nr:hypothetical protein [uncultured Agrococcus sp.]
MAIVVVVLGGCSLDIESEPQGYPGPASEEESHAIYVECMAGFGWEVEDATGDGGFSPGEIPEEQLQDFHDADSSCWQEASIHPEYFSQADWERWYESLKETTRCLEAEGYSIPNQPTLQQFIDGQGLWTPYEYLLDEGIIIGSELPAMHAVCPEEMFWPEPRD